MQTKFALFLLSCTLWTLSINAQSPILENYIQEALKQNLSVKARQLNHQKQQSRIEQANKLWGLSIDFDASYLLAA
ncbi:MAG: hypothetical protein AB8B69_20170, partial [Chitinophagales bacterium]